ncbi:protein P10b [Raspberry latent virus]|uniref:protein P10b n=1 Tax=Raspberry latent virus TaxID=907191 RepID=UPI0001E69022|nr:protein P10b [Raspberry latent virus]ADO27697.1 protein P10b [Raspberry latent virus]
MAKCPACRINLIASRNKPFGTERWTMFHNSNIYGEIAQFGSESVGQRAISNTVSESVRSIRHAFSSPGIYIQSSSESDRSNRHIDEANLSRASETENSGHCFQLVWNGLWSRALQMWQPNIRRRRSEHSTSEGSSVKAGLRSSKRSSRRAHGSVLPVSDDPSIHPGRTVYSCCLSYDQSHPEGFSPVVSEDLGSGYETKG